MSERMPARTAHIHVGNATEGNGHMPGRRKAALLMVSLAAAAGISAPVANARPTCQDTFAKTICSTNGSTSIKARPGTVAPPANLPMMPWLGMPGRRR